MRFLIGEFAHESNCFSPILTTLDSFREREYLIGGELIAAHEEKRTVLSGFISVIRAEGHETVPAISAHALPSGPVTGGAYDVIVGALLATARSEVDRLDGVLLSLHGAMSVVSSHCIDDPEGMVTAAVRDIVGPNLPIAVVLDPHSDTTDLLLTNADLTLSYNEEPHRDAYDRGIEAAELILRLARREIRPVKARVHPPLLITGTHTTTDEPPMKEVHDLRSKLEEMPGVLDISVHFGYFGTDQVEGGFSVVCTTDGDPILARQLAGQVAAAAWFRRKRFLPTLVSPPQAVAEALRDRLSVGLVDECDDPAGGGSAESVTLLRAMLDGGVERGGVTTVLDSVAVRLMAEAGEGAEVSLRLGARTDPTCGAPIDVNGRVALIHRAPVPLDVWSGRTFDAGIVSVLDIRGVLVAVTERKLVTENIDLLELLGYDVAGLQIAGFKGLAGHVRQAIGGKMSRYLRIDGAGLTHRDVRRIGPYRNIRRPIWPLDDLPDNAFQAHS